MVGWSSLRDAPILTMRGERTALAIVKGSKGVENRHFKLRGWVWLCAGLRDTDPVQAAIIDEQTTRAPPTPQLRGTIIGAAHFSDTISVEAARKDPLLAPWASGPKCSIIDDVFELAQPVAAKGTLHLNYKIDEELKEQLRLSVGDGNDDTSSVSTEF